MPKAEHPRREGLSYPQRGEHNRMTRAAFEPVPLSASGRFIAMSKDYFDEACSFGALYKGLKKSCRNVRWKDSVVGYEANGLRNTLVLSRALKNGTYRISKYQVFKVHEPKERTIVASRLVDRQFQRALCDSGLYEDIVEHLIRDNVACQTGRGTDDALNRMKVHLQRHYRKHGLDGWVLRCDIHHFFPTTRHDLAKATVRKYVEDARAAEAVCTVIDSFGGNVGIGLGSQISQLVELLVLNDLDHFIKERLHIKGYIRYMDDFILIHPDKEYLKYCLTEIRKRLEALGFEMNENKTVLHPLRQGITFLQWRFLMTETGKILMLMRPAKLSKQKRRMKKLWAKEQEQKLLPGTTKDSFTAFLANAERGNTWKMRESMKQFYQNLTGDEYK